MKTTTKRDEWKAVRRGARYCAPKCGGGCTYAAYQRARRDATALAKSLGKGWRGHVWENLGWHYSVKHPAGFELYAHADDQFWVTTTDHTQQYHAHGDTAANAIRNLRRELEKTALLIGRLRDEVVLAGDERSK